MLRIDVDEGFELYFNVVISMFETMSRLNVVVSVLRFVRDVRLNEGQGFGFMMQ